MIRIPALLALGLAAMPSAGDDVPLRPSDFAYGARIEPAGDGPLYEVTLPRAVYESVTRADLGDLRVFNARGEVVPHALRRREAREAPGEWLRLPLFPVRSADKRKPDELSLRIEKGAGGSIVNVLSGPAAGRGAPVVMYIADASAAAGPLRALEVNWKDGPAGGFAGSLRVDASDDLRQWRNVASDAPVVRLRHDGRLLERRRVELAPVRAKYLRLLWTGTERAAALTEIKAERAADAPLPACEWLTLAPAEAKPGEYRFGLDGHMPVDRARVRLPQANTVAHVELASRAGPTDSWRLRASGLAYRLRKNGGELTGEDLTLSPGNTGDREWRLRVSQHEGGLGSGQPALELGWVPQAVVFVARGEGPFTLAYGSAGLLPGDYSLERLLRDFASRDKQELAPQEARPGGTVTLGGAERLRVPFTARPWRKWLLWGALGLGVFFLGWMAARLLRQLQSPGGGAS